MHESTWQSAAEHSNFRYSLLTLMFVNTSWKAKYFPFKQKMPFSRKFSRRCFVSVSTVAIDFTLKQRIHVQSSRRSCGEWLRPIHGRRRGHRDEGELEGGGEEKEREGGDRGRRPTTWALCFRHSFGKIFFIYVDSYASINFVCPLQRPHSPPTRCHHRRAFRRRKTSLKYS